MIINFVEKTSKTITPIIVSEISYENDVLYNYKVGDYIQLSKSQYKQLKSVSNSKIKEFESTGFYKIIGVVYDTKIDKEGNILIHKTPTLYVENSTPPWC